MNLIGRNKGSYIPGRLNDRESEWFTRPVYHSVRSRSDLYVVTPNSGHGKAFWYFTTTKLS